MKIKILKCAELELNTAIDYYNNQMPGLGFEFAIEFKESLIKLKNFPNAWPVFSNSTRRFLIRKFPYGILYQNRQKEILILAIMHLKQNPKNWENINS